MRMSDAVRHLPVVCLIAAFIAWTAPAMGHAQAEREVPSAGATLSRPPALVSIYFDSELEPLFSRLTVRNVHGEKVSVGSGKVAQDNPRLLAARLSRLSKGTYRVYWDVVARDGHRAKGDYTFTVQ